jgi:hypothetical protein
VSEGVSVLVPLRRTLRERALPAILTPRGVVLCLIGLATLSAGARIGLLTHVYAPTVFMDELGYQKLAQSIGRTGDLALFNQHGMSFSPLYPLVLSPIYALGASAPTAYHWIKIVDAILISLSIFPTYKIARFVLARRESLFVAAIGAFAPLMYYSAFTMSENLAYPLALVAIWAMLAALRAPSPRSDALLLGAIVLVSAARVQLIVLLPAALTAPALAAVFGRERAGESLAGSLAKRLRQHWLLFSAPAAFATLAGLGAFAGHGVLSITGRYENVVHSGVPDLWRMLEVAVEHVAGIEFAVGVFPFVAALVTAYVFFRAGTRREYVPFASVAVAVTAWLLLEVAFDAARFDGGVELPRIHERFLIYVVPFFLVALLAAVRLPESKASVRIYLGAAAVATLLPALIPYHKVINLTNVVDTFGLQLFGRPTGTKYVPIPHVTLVAVWVAATFALTYVVVRNRMRGVIAFVLLVSIGTSMFISKRIQDGSAGARSRLPASIDWVDRATSSGDVILVTGAGPVSAAMETSFNNLSIARVYNLCKKTFGAEFGEQRLTVDEAGRLRDSSSGFVRARYVVVPDGLVVRGRVVAWNREGHQVLIASPKGPVSLRLATRSVDCSADLKFRRT